MRAMSFFQSVDPVTLSLGFVAYIGLLLILLSFYIRRSPEAGSGDGVVAEFFSPDAAVSPLGPSSHAPAAGNPMDRAGVPSELLAELEEAYRKDKDPVWVTDSGFRVYYANRSACRTFHVSETQARAGAGLATLVGADAQDFRELASKADAGSSSRIRCTLPDGGESFLGVGFSVVNRLPKVYAIRIHSVDSGKEVSGAPALSTGTSLTRGGSLNFRELDPDSVELSSDQMLEPLREIDGLLARAGKERPGQDTESMRLARGKVRRMIHHIEEIDWMLQVNQGQLHVRKETFRPVFVVEELVEAANRHSGTLEKSIELHCDAKETTPESFLGDRRVFEKVLTQLISAAFRSGSGERIDVHYRSTPLHSPVHSDDWHLFVGEESGTAIGRENHIEIGIEFSTPGPGGSSDLPTVVETLGSQILDPRTARRLDFVKKGRDSDLFGLTLARELVSQLKGELYFEPVGAQRVRFRLAFDFEKVAGGTADAG